MTMSEAKSKKKNSTVGHFSTDLIFSRVMYLLGTNQLNFSVLFNFELAPVPTSLFKDSGEAQYTKVKSRPREKDESGSLNTWCSPSMCGG